MFTTELVIIDPTDKFIALQISELLTEATDTFKASKGGHVPDEIVSGIIHKNYTSLFAIQNTFKETGYRFALLDQDDQVIGTALVAKDTETIFIVDGKNVNAQRTNFINLCPPQYHNILNFVIKKDHQQAGYGSELLKRLVAEYRHLFLGKGLWLRSDPPNHTAYEKMGFFHDTKYDQFLPVDALLPEGYTSVEEFNQRNLCRCSRTKEQIELSKTCRYKYCVFTYDFKD